MDLERLFRYFSVLVCQKPAYIFINIYKLTRQNIGKVLEQIIQTVQMLLQYFDFLY